MLYTAVTPHRVTTLRSALVALCCDPFCAVNTYGPVPYQYTYPQACKQIESGGMVNEMCHALAGQPALVAWLHGSVVRQLLLASATLQANGNNGMHPRQWWGLPAGLLPAAWCVASIWCMP